MKKSRGRALRPSARPAQTHSSWGRGGSRSRGSRTTGGIWGGHRETGEAIRRWALGSDCPGRRSPSGGRGLPSHPTPHPYPGAPSVPEERPDTLERPLRARFLSPVRRDSGSPVPKACPHPLWTSLVLQSRPVTLGGGRRGTRAAKPPSPSGPGSRRAPQWRGRGLPGRGHARPRPRRPPAGSPDWPQPARPRPGGGVWGGGGARPAAGVRLLR